MELDKLELLVTRRMARTGQSMGRTMAIEPEVCGPKWGKATHFSMECQVCGPKWGNATWATEEHTFLHYRRLGRQALATEPGFSARQGLEGAHRTERIIVA